MAGPERSFIDKVHRQVEYEWELYKQCNTGIVGANGVPDYYYEHEADHCWVEYKATKAGFPTVIELTAENKRYALTPLQWRWCNRAVKNGVPCYVVLGSLEGGIIFANRTWEKVWKRDDLWSGGYFRTPKQIAEFIAGIGNHRVVK